MNLIIFQQIEKLEKLKIVFLHLNTFLYFYKVFVLAKINHASAVEKCPMLKLYAGFSFSFERSLCVLKGKSSFSTFLSQKDGRTCTETRWKLKK